AVSSSSAARSVSATNTPPYGPKWPRPSGSAYSDHPDSIFTSHAPNEFDDLRGILDPAARFHSARHVHGPRPHFANGLPDVFARQAAGKDERDRQARRYLLPVESTSRPTALARHVRVQQQRLRPGKSTCIF